MRRLAYATRGRAAVVAALLGLLACAMASPAPAAAEKATLRVVKLNPLTISGAGFKPVERVTVTLSAARTGTAKGTATAAGSVTVSVPKAKVTACSAYTLRAVGSAGTK